MKLTNKKTVIVFPNMENKKEAINFLLKTNIPFQGIIRKPILFIAPSRYLKKYLDIYLPEHIAASTFNYKDSVTTKKIRLNDYINNFILNDKRTQF